MNVKSVFFQTNLDEETVPTETLTLRGQIKAPCPGSKTNTVSLAIGEKANQFSLGRPKNIGTCEAYILFYDQTGTYLSHYVLQPGEEISGIYPPSNTFYVKFGCSPKCGGTAILEYDVTDIA